MTPIEIFTAICGMVWIVTSIVLAVQKGRNFDSGATIHGYYEGAMEHLFYPTLLLVYFYLLWFRGPVPQPVEHNELDYFAAFFAGLTALLLLGSLVNLLLWLRLEFKGMEYGYGSGGVSAGLFRVSKRLSPTEALLDVTTRDRREAEQIARGIELKQTWWTATIVAVVAIAATVIASGYGSIVAWIAGIVALGPAITFWIKATFESIVYKIGAQFIPGAKVLEPEAPKLGLGEVYNQKAHGAARLATEAETIAAASAGAQRSRVHDQEF